MGSERGGAGRRGVALGRKLSGVTDRNEAERIRAEWGQGWMVDVVLPERQMMTTTDDEFLFFFLDEVARQCLNGARRSGVGAGRSGAARSGIG